MSTESPTPQERIAVDYDNLGATVEQLVEIVTEQAAHIDDQNERIADLEEELAEERADRAEADAEDRKRLTDVEERLEDVESGDEPHPSDGEKTATDDAPTPQTPLEDLASMPARVVENESANVRRAVFVARDLGDYTNAVPAGRAIRSSELKQVLVAGTDADGHSQTVDRVIRVLDDLGGDEVKVVERRGERRIVFTDETVARLEELGQHAEQDGSHGVVMGGEV